MTAQGEGWQSVSDLLGARGQGGELYLNADTTGCHFCGAVRERVVPLRKGGTMTVYYPGVECCPEALRRQVKWRIQDIETINNTMRERDKLVVEMRGHVDVAPTRAMAEAAAKKAEAAEKSLHRDISEIYTPQLRRASGELARLKEKLAVLEGAAEER